MFIPCHKEKMIDQSGTARKSHTIPFRGRAFTFTEGFRSEKSGGLEPYLPQLPFDLGPVFFFVNGPERLNDHQCLEGLKIGAHKADYLLPGQQISPALAGVDPEESPQEKCCQKKPFYLC